MSVQSFRAGIESKVLACGPQFALLSTFVPALPNSVLVQLFRNCVGSSGDISLYALYREGDMTFEAIVGFEAETPGLAMKDVLKRFVVDSAFDVAVIEPLAEKVREHFRR